MVLAGLGLAALGFAGKHLIYRMPTVTSKFSESLRHLPKFNAETLANSKFYKGGFESKMSKREASLILGVSPTANKLRVSNHFPIPFSNLIRIFKTHLTLIYFHF